MPKPRHRRVHAHNPWTSPGPVDLHLEVPDWTRDASCAEIGVEVFFNDGGSDHTTYRAKKICQRCPVVTDCLEWALGFDPVNDEFGIFGGIGPKERLVLRRQRQMEVAA